MAQPITVEKEQDFHSKSLWVFLFLPCIWEVLTYYNFYLMCVCVCMHAFEHLYMCGYAYTYRHVEARGQQWISFLGRCLMGFFNSLELDKASWLARKPYGSPCLQLPTIGTAGTPTFYSILDIKFRPLLFTRLAISWWPISLVLHVLSFIYLGYSRSKLAISIQVKDREENYDH